MPQVTLIVSADTSVGTAKNSLQVRYPAIRAYHRIDSVFADGMLLAFSLILCAFPPGNSIRFFCSVVKDVTRTLLCNIRAYQHCTFFLSKSHIIYFFEIRKERQVGPLSFTRNRPQLRRLPDYPQVHQRPDFR